MHASANYAGLEGHILVAVTAMQENAMYEPS